MSLRPLTVLVAAVALFATAIAVLLVDRDHARATAQREREGLDRSLLHEASAQTAHAESQFAKARATLLLTVRNPAFADFYRRLDGRAPAPWGHGRTPAQRASERRVEAALGYLARLFKGSIGEACFVDRSGVEIARAVHGAPVHHHDLIPDKSNRPFFGPAFEYAREGKVHQGRPSLSKDTDDWTLPNATVVPGTGGRALVHFDMTVESFRRALALGARDTALHTRIFDRATGTVLVDGEVAQRKGGVLGQPADPDLDPLAGTRAEAGLSTIRGERVAWRRVKLGEANFNDWVLAVSAPALAANTAVNPWLAGLVVLAFLFLLFAIWRVRSRQAALRTAAMTDTLTGLANRRALMHDLEAALVSASAERPLIFALFDLDGFKAYNDAFGHPAGDALLERLGRRLAASLPPEGRAYRLGGDEFCLLTPLPWDGAEGVVASATAALCEEGEGFHVTASGGTLLLPADAQTCTRALMLADQRMYAHKDSRRPSPASQARDLLMRVLEEREPRLHDHVNSVADLSVRVGRRFGMTPEELDELRRAAELHDIGKMAVPDSILNKPGALNDEEWAFMRRHTIIGERILSAAPAMVPVAKLVRASHERWDGRGYPDGLAGEDIPLGARIILACDALQAMASDRPYAPAQPYAEALDEIRRSAGNQLDPSVVDALLAAYVEEAAEPTPPPPQHAGAR